MGKNQLRDIGIDTIGTAPWSTHLCQFYDTKQDLIDILVPYFKAGLQNNEFCIWVTSEPLPEEEAGQAMRKAMPDFGQYLKRGQIEIVSHTAWYLKGGDFNGQRVVNAWIDKLNQALANGYDGMRVTGNVSWLEEEDRTSFTEYEEELNRVIGNYNMLVICAYLSTKCGVGKIIDVIGNHQFALIRQAGDWVVLKPKKGQAITLEAAPRRQLTLLEKRFQKYGLKGFSNPEIIELLLCHALLPKEGKKLSHEVTKRYKTLRQFLAAPISELELIPGMTPRCSLCFQMLCEVPQVFLKERIVDKPVSTSSQEVFDFLYYSMRDLKKEVFKVVYLDNRNKIIYSEDLFEGTLDGIHIYPREIEEGAIKHKATGLIFVHNHPSGDCSPSKNDKQITRDLVFIGKVLQIKVLDHLIIGENKYFSFADTGLVEKYETAFINLRLRKKLVIAESYN